MKKNISIFWFCICFLATGAAAAQDLSLPAETPAHVRTLAREMVSDGLSEDAVSAMTRNMMSHGFNEAQMVRAQKMVLTSSRQGFPAGPLMLKAGEGMAKQVAPERILQAMENVRHRYTNAWKHAGILPGTPQQRKQLGETIAQGMSAGLDAGAVERISRQLQHRKKSSDGSSSSELSIESYRTARDLSRMGINSNTAADLVCSAVSNGYSADRMKQLRQQFRTQHTRAAATELGEEYRYRFQHGQDPLSDPPQDGGGSRRHKQKHGNQGHTGGGDREPSDGSGGHGGDDSDGGSDDHGGDGGGSGEGGDHSGDHGRGKGH
ncbi:MAG: hypothetical protein HKM93_11950 [Desulfobacteraceae bacterium]|nr:hypothetical protein [Desulfobacteraceae bacterium]